MARYSNQLYRGEIRDFMEAMDAVAEMCREEKAIGAGEGESLGPVIESSLDEYAATAAKLRAEFFQRVKVRLANLERELTESLAAEWQASEDEDVRRIGEALESGDYSELAI